MKTEYKGYTYTWSAFDDGRFTIYDGNNKQVHAVQGNVDAIPMRWIDAQETKQKLFNNAYIGLKAQGKWSVGELGCAYRGPNGEKCAVGFNINDAEYSDGMEGQDASAEQVRQAVIDSGHNLDEIGDWLEHFQYHTHDKPCDKNEGFTLQPLIDFANEEGLTIPEGLNR